MFTKEYWAEKAKLIMEDCDPSLYRKLKKSGIL